MAKVKSPDIIKYSIATLVDMLIQSMEHARSYSGLEDTQENRAYNAGVREAIRRAATFLNRVGIPMGKYKNTFRASCPNGEPQMPNEEDTHP